MKIKNCKLKISRNLYLVSESDQHGISVIELLIYVGLVASITIIFTSFTVDVIRNSLKVLTIKEVSQSSRLLLSRISQELKTATEITSLAADQIVYKDASGNTATINFDSGSKAVYYDNGTGAVALSNDTVRVTDFSFDQVSDQAIGIGFSIAQKNEAALPLQRYELDVHSTVIPRPQLY